MAYKPGNHRPSFNESANLFASGGLSRQSVLEDSGGYASVVAQAGEFLTAAITIYLCGLRPTALPLLFLTPTSRVPDPTCYRQLGPILRGCIHSANSL